MIKKQVPYIIIGGTFDPVHNGHVLIAQKLYEVFQSPITFIPTAAPNYKAPPQATAQQRLEMLSLALDDDKRFIIDTSEIFSPRYIPTIESLRSFRKKIGYSTPIYFLIGEDSLVTLDTWDNYSELFGLTNFIVAIRPGYSLNSMSTELMKEFNQRVVNEFNNLDKPYGQIYILDFAPLDISSTQIRKNISQNLPIDHLANPKVIKFIIENKLYLNKNFC